MIYVLCQLDSEPFSMGDNVYLVADSPENVERAKAEIARLRERLEEAKDVMSCAKAVFDDYDESEIDEQVGSIVLLLRAYAKYATKPQREGE